MNSDEFLAAPEIVRRLVSQDAFENETVTFTCTVQNADNINEDEPYSIAWFFADKQIEGNNEKYSIDENAKTGICLLTIRNILPDDEGAYRCVATNKYGSSVTTGFLAVLSKYSDLSSLGIEKLLFLGRKRSQSPSPSRNASPGRSLSPSGTRTRDRSVSPLRYINLPMSKLARVTEELESLINPTASTVHEEEEEEEENKKDALVPEQPTIMDIAKPEESIVLPQVVTSVEKPEEIPLPMEQEKPIETKLVEPEESIVLPQILSSIPTTTAAAATEIEQKVSTITTEVSHRIYLNIFSNNSNEQLIKRINSECSNTVRLLTVSNQIILYHQ